jgi:hypothetical protein
MESQSTPMVDRTRWNPLRWLAHQEGWRTSILWGAVGASGMRCIFGIVMAAAWIVVKPNLAPELLDSARVYGAVQMPTDFPADAFLGVWARWDAVHYLNLSLRGYAGVSEGDSIFYPLYPGLIRILAFCTNGDVLLAGLILSTLASWVALTCLHRLAADHFGPNVAPWAVVALACFPTSFFLIAPFTESLFLALTLAAFLSAYRGKWWLAGFFGCLASLTRGPGILTSLALVIIAAHELRQAKVPWSGSKLGGILFGLCMPVAGGAVFLGWRFWAGYPSVTEILKNYSGLVMTDPISGLWASLSQWFHHMDFASSLEVFVAIAFLALLVPLAFSSRWRNVEWLIFVFANLMVFLSKQSQIASSLQSLPRYVLTLFPVFLLIGGWLAEQSRRTRFIYVSISSFFAIVFSVLFTFWIFVG